MHHFICRLSIACITLLSAVSAQASVPDTTPIGFTAANARVQLSLEARFDAGLDAREMRAWLERMAGVTSEGFRFMLLSPGSSQCDA
jgi:hypothetical protein